MIWSNYGRPTGVRPWFSGLLAVAISGLMAAAGMAPASASGASPSLPTGSYINASVSKAEELKDNPGLNVGFTEFATADTVRVTIATTSGTLSISNTVSLTAVPGSTLSRSGTLIDFLGTPANANLALESLAFRAASNNAVADITFEVQESSDATFEVAAGETHVYKVVPASQTGYGANITWVNAKAWAETQSIPAAGGGNCPGYLATITSAAEQSFLSARVKSESWIGASDDVTYLNQVPGLNFANQTAAEGKWYWVTGPDAGTQLLASNDRNNRVNDAYNNFASGEPNNWNGSEHYAQMLLNGGWNDLGSSSTQASIIVEFGSPSCQPAVAASKLVSTMRFSAATSLSAPAITELNRGDGELEVAWGLPAGGISASSYELQYRELGSQAWQPVTLADSGLARRVTITGLNNNLRYEAQVRAAVVSSPSNIVSAWSASVATAVNLGAPVAPTINAISPDSDSASIEFLPAAPVASAVTKYQYSIDGGASWLDFDAAIPDSPFEITGLTPGASSMFQLRAVNNFGAGEASTQQAITTKPSWGTGKPRNLIVGSAFSYVFQVAGATSLSLSSGQLPAGLTLTATGLAGTPTVSGPYQFTISASNSAGSKTRQFSGVVASLQAEPPVSNPGTIPAQLVNNPPQRVFGDLSAAAQAALKAANIVQPVPNLPTAGYLANLSGLDPRAELNIDVAQAAEIGQAVSFSVRVDLEESDLFDVLAFIKLDSGWQFLGRGSFVAGQFDSQAMVFGKPGVYPVRLVIAEKSVADPGSLVINSIQATDLTIFSTSAAVFSIQSFSDSDTQLGNLVVDIDITVSAGDTTPAIVEPTPPTAPPDSQTPIEPPAPAPTPEPAPTPTPTPTPEPSPAPTAPAPTPEPPLSPEPEAEPAAEPEEEPAAEPAQEPATEVPASPGSDAAAEPGQPADTEATDEEAPAPLFELFGFGPKANAAIGASGDDSVIEAFDPYGTPEAMKATNQLLGATAALVAIAAAAGAAGAAASAAGSAGSGASGSANSGGAEMNEDSLDAMAAADYEYDVFKDVQPRWGDKLAIFAIPLFTALDRRTLVWTHRWAKITPLGSKLLNDGAYLRAMLGSFSALPLIAAIVIAIMSLQQNAGELIHPPVFLFLALVVIGLFDGFAGAAGVLVFLLGSLPLVDFSNVSELRMLAGTAIAGFGPILLARTARNFRRLAPTDTQGLLDRIGDIAFASLIGGWVAGLVVRALPALTGLTLPAANYVETFQGVATVAIATRIILEDLAARYFPARMNALVPDSIPEPYRAQPIVVTGLKYIFYVFIASAFMGFGPIVWIASALFLAPTIIGFFADRFPRVPLLEKILPTGLPGLAMILGLEIWLEGTLEDLLDDHPDFSVIFIMALLTLILLVSILGILARPQPDQPHWLASPRLKWLYRAGGVLTVFLLIYFTSQL